MKLSLNFVVLLLSLEFCGVGCGKIFLICALCMLVLGVDQLSCMFIHESVTGHIMFASAADCSSPAGCRLRTVIYTVNQRKTPKWFFGHIFHKTQWILIKFGVYCPE